jgi:ABC-type Fe3+/spermidine/putrescine transport system ATPase subunit
VDANQDRPLSESAQPIIAIRGVTRRFGETTAVDDISLDIGRGEFFCLLGASGCGKTTLLRMIAGFDEPDSGRISIDGRDMTHWPAWRRPVNMMFQSYALFPHLTVAANVGFGLREEGRPRAEIRERVTAALEMFDMGTFAARKPHQLSGGQKQRVALARALVKQPKILLLDEPLAALDKKLRERAQLELVRLRERLGITFVMVTHDQEEAMAMATRIALMRHGKIVQVGTPHELYEKPVSRYVAEFFGEANLFEDSGKTVMVRPEQMRLAKQAPPQGKTLQGRVESLVFLGSFYNAGIVLDGGKAVQARLSPAELADAGSPQEGDAVHVFWKPGAARFLSQ